MKHVILYEKVILEAGGDSSDFQFFPFDLQKEPPSKYGLPETANLEDLISLKESDIPDSAWQPGKGTGLFIAHKNNPNGGFIRAIVRSTSPLTFDIASFDRDYQKVDEKLGISKENLGAIQKESDGFKFLGELRKSFPEIFDYLKSESGRSDLAADMGELFY